MKKTLSLIMTLALLLTFAAFALGSGSSGETKPEKTQETAQKSEDENTQKEDTQKDDAQDAQESGNAPVEDVQTDSSQNEKSASNWRQFIKEYGEWVDQYVELVKKYKNAPSDLALLAQYTKLVVELAEWSEKADELEEEMSDEDALEYSKELLKITQKLAEVGE